MDTVSDRINKLAYEKEQREKAEKSAFLNLRPLMGYANWAEFYCIISARMQGKTYMVLDWFLHDWQKNGTVFYWLRGTEAMTKKLLADNAHDLVDPDLAKRYKLDLVTAGPLVYHVTKRSAPDKNGKTKILEKKLLARVYSLSTFYKLKGVGIFDKDYIGNYNIALDEFCPEKGEKISYPMSYCFVNTLENLVRNTKQKMRIFMLANAVAEASEILCLFDFIPEDFGIYKLKSKRCVIWNVEPTASYKEMRKGSVADILMPNASTFTNKIDTDNTLIDKSRLTTPSYVIRFTKDDNDAFTVWNGNIITQYNGEKKPVIAMRPYLDEVFTTEQQKNIILLFDTRCFRFRNLITFKKFQSAMSDLKPRQ